MTTTVININEVRHLKENGKPWPEPYVYIGRPSMWGNPFTIGEDGTREEVIEKFSAYMDHDHSCDACQNTIKKELKDKTLVCWCKPLACHGDVLAELADA